jgi:hypothetical protein
MSQRKDRGWFVCRWWMDLWSKDVEAKSGSRADNLHQRGHHLARVSTLVTAGVPEKPLTWIKANLALIRFTAKGHREGSGPCTSTY